ncbi:MAG: hypothetical protein IJF19_00915 [Clostridia bacterium]|nr:hypothetical protein [Clostridia bacterium]
MKALKKLLCLILSALVMQAVAIPCFAEDISLEDSIESAFMSYCTGKVPMHIEDIKEVTVKEIHKINDIAVFTADSWKWQDHGIVDVTLLKWDITASHHHFPYDLGVYVYTNEKILTLEESVEAEILTDLDFLDEFDGISCLNHDAIKLCEEAFLRYKNTATSDEVWVECSPRGKVKGYLFFSGEIHIAGSAYPTIVVEAKIGNYIYRAGHPKGPESNPTGLYALSDDGTVCPAHELYDKGILTDTEIAKGAGGILSTELDEYGEHEYEEIIIPALSEKYPDVPLQIPLYSEHYIRYAKDRNTGEKTPLYAVISVWGTETGTVQDAHIVNDIVLEGKARTPFTYHYGVYVFETGEFLDIIDVPESDLEAKENIYKCINYSYRMGDNNRDFNLTIQDATYMQKCLAKLKDFREDDEITMYFQNPKKRVYISDYNRDGMRNIKDATAIQKRLANITP